jgi:hypothetical protein
VRAKYELTTIDHTFTKTSSTLWTRLYTKHYELPGFQSSEVVAASLGLEIIQAEENYKSYLAASTVFNVRASAKVLDEYDYPVFFADKQLVSAL